MTDSAIDCVLVIDKPAGPTSHDVVAVVRRAMRVTRIGHTGTLDPLATGVLPLVMGRATRLASFMSSAEKEYVASVRFGRSTPTYDAEGAGEVDDSGTGPIPRDAAAVAEALPAFLGSYLQQPPPFSAKKIGGTPAYKLARQGKATDIKPSEVTVRNLELRDYADGVAEIRIVCTSGFYVRSLAHELGQRLGCGAFLLGLQRVRAGDFTLHDAVPLGTVVEEGIDGPAVRARSIPMDRLLPHIPAVALSEDGVTRARHGSVLRGRDITEMPPLAPSHVRLLDPSGGLVGIAEPMAGGFLHPTIVLV